MLPQTFAEYQEYSPGVFRFDCSSTLNTHSLKEPSQSLLTEVSANPEIENATYNGWKTDHFIMNVLVFLPKGVSVFLSRNVHQGITIYCSTRAVSPSTDVALQAPLVAALTQNTSELG